jgi:dTDP-4-dehydrorhamnose 3,5-epimerase
MHCPIEGVVIRPLQRHSDVRGWLTELFRSDELPDGFIPQMAYISMTLPGIARGPHEHRLQQDGFCFIGPSTFRLYLWDNRKSSPTYGVYWTCDVGESAMTFVVVPAGVVHGYKNIGQTEGIVFNAPDQLYAGKGRTEAVDEIRHERVENSPYRIP